MTHSVQAFHINSTNRFHYNLHVGVASTETAQCETHFHSRWSRESKTRIEYHQPQHSRWKNQDRGVYFTPDFIVEMIIMRITSKKTSKNAKLKLAQHITYKIPIYCIFTRHLVHWFTFIHCKTSHNCTSFVVEIEMFAAHRSTWYSNDTRGIGTADLTFYIILPAFFSLAFSLFFNYMHHQQRNTITILLHWLK